jgi:hypothetical protein
MTDAKDVNVSTGASGAGDTNDPAKIAKIEAEIDQTRGAITGDLRTLGERLSPEHLREEAKQVMSDAKDVAVDALHEAKDVATNTFREVKESAMETVNDKMGEIREDVRRVEREAVGFLRQNAVPLALMGIGAAWFVSNRRSHDRSWDGDYAPRGHGRWRYPERSDDRPLDQTRERLSRAGDTTREYAHRTRDRARDWAEQAEHRVEGVAGQVRGFAEREVDQARGLARDARDRIGRATSQARDLAQREYHQARDFSVRTTQTHPLAVGAAAIAAGVCVGLLIPETDRENELLGPQRARLVEGARGALDDAKQASTALKDTAKETARDVTRDVKNSLTGSTG